VGWYIVGAIMEASCKDGHKYIYVSFLDRNFAEYYVSKYSFLHAFCFKDLFIAC